MPETTANPCSCSADLEIAVRERYSDAAGQREESLCCPVEYNQKYPLWSGCISGAFREDLFIEAFREAGFHGMEIVQRQDDPWQVVEGIEFRSVTVLAYKGDSASSEGCDACEEETTAVVYRGPFEFVQDDDARIYRRGERVAVGGATFHRLQQPPYTGLFYSADAAENSLDRSTCCAPDGSCC